MTDGWVLVFDASGGWPNDAQACWNAGYRAIAGYVNQGSWKSFTAALRDRWITAAHPFGFAPMYEAEGDEPANDPDVGTAHAHAARAGMRALFGAASDVAAIAYAMDRNTSPGNANVRHYYTLVKAADTATPVGYIESDAGLPLVAAGILAGVFEPAAYAWDNRSSAMTPATAPVGVLWTQEHNGVTVAGSGTVDTGHIRTSAPIWWPATEGDDMPLSDDDVTKVWAADVVDNWRSDASTNPEIQTGHALSYIGADVAAVKAAVAAIPTAAPIGTLSDADKDDIAGRVVALLDKQHLSN